MNNLIAPRTYLRITFLLTFILLFTNYTIYSQCGPGEDSLSPMIILCPENSSIEGCDSTDIFPTSILPFSLLDSIITLSQFQEEGGLVVDNCDIETIAYRDISLGSCPYVMRLWRITDPSGNSTSCIQGFLIVDTSVPFIIQFPVTPIMIEGCDPTDIFPTSTLPFSELGSTITPSQFLEEGGMVDDGCGVASITYKDFTSGDCPYKVYRTWAFMDNCGNTTVKPQVFNILDTLPPSWIIDPANLFVECDTINSLESAITEWLNMHGGGEAIDDCGSLYYSNDYSLQTDECSEFPDSLAVTFTVTDNCGNSIDKTVIVVVTNTTSLVEVETYDYSVYPNPTNGHIYFHTPAFRNQIIEVVIIDHLGERVWRQKFDSDSVAEIDLSEKQMASGIYFILIRLADKIIKQRIVIIR